MKKISWLLSFVMLLSVAMCFNITALADETAASVSEYWTGSGTESDPYIISDWQGLCALRDNTNSQTSDYEGVYFALSADIIGNYQFGAGIGFKGTTKVGNERLTDSVFKGNFDGKEHIVVLSAASNGNDSSAGLFGYAEGGIIKNIIFGDPGGEISTNISVPSNGGLIGYGKNLVIDNCVNYSKPSAKTTGSSYGGIAGYLADSVVTACKMVI